MLIMQRIPVILFIPFWFGLMVFKEEPSRTPHQGKALVDALCDRRLAFYAIGWPSLLRVLAV
jgi:hypothetical protein